MCAHILRFCQTEIYIYFYIKRTEKKERNVENYIIDYINILNIARCVYVSTNKMDVLCTLYVMLIHNLNACAITKKNELSSSTFCFHFKINISLCLSVCVCLW